ncbi:glycosyltransferase family 32 protein [Eubacterium oxidoreducens]|uniref:Glycosyltransferase sugar-binding region containing DXD motif-containing protein n=1 Tax=Eubacterium oxidoreducens TaxID=1732 RepID=A0A1G6AE78_EUBOX|nr:glycosyltransferase [Eubacterium oxidoreducens]SDB06721.1 Glycosyltransferase sugar-binding region containing DXD motif-containing protein [Eubacterium oxidoreducens]
MIPKIVHYCWFGGNEMPDKVKRCMDSWHENLPDYQFIEWNEKNFDVYSSAYVKEAYENKKYAFVSDVARAQALKEYGGIYLDTDVMVFQSFDKILDHRCVFGFEYGNWIATSFMACEKNHPALDIFVSSYEGAHFMNADGTMNTTTNVQRLTHILEGRGLKRNNEKQEIQDGIVIYPIEYFSPYDYVNCIMEKTDNSICAHLFFVSWMSKKEQTKKVVKGLISKTLGKNVLEKIRKNKEG